MKYISFIVITLILISSVAAIDELPPPGTLPTSGWYDFKRGAENIGTLFTFGDKNQAQRSLNLASLRLAEIKALNDIDEPPGELVKDYHDSIRQSAAIATRSSDPSVPSLVSSETRDQLLLIDDIIDSVPESSNSGFQTVKQYAIESNKDAIYAYASRDPAAAAEFAIEMADDRLARAKKYAALKPERLEDSLKDYKSYRGVGETVASIARLNGDEYNSIKLRVIEAKTEQLKTLSSLTPQVPEEQKTMVRDAIHDVQKERATIIRAIDDEPKPDKPSTPRSVSAVCGNGVLELTEECDDSNNRGDDGCDPLCLLESTEPSCMDSDGFQYGSVGYVKGYRVNERYTATDICAGNSTLIEQYCEGVNARNESYPCTCSNGACVPQTNVPTPPTTTPPTETLPPPAIVSPPTVYIPAGPQPIPNATTNSGRGCIDPDGLNFYNKGSTTAIVTREDLCLVAQAYHRYATVNPSGIGFTSVPISFCPSEEFAGGSPEAGKCAAALSVYAETCTGADCFVGENYCKPSSSTMSSFLYRCEVGCLNGACIPVSAPSPVCGNGAREAGEQCDDGNLVNADGCSTVCVLDNPAINNPMCTDTDGGFNPSANGNLTQPGTTTKIKDACVQVIGYTQVTSLSPIMYQSVSDCPDERMVGIQGEGTDNNVHVGDCFGVMPPYATPDQCSGHDCILIEWACGNKGSINRHIRCADGCTNGACLGSYTVPPVETPPPAPSPTPLPPPVVTPPIAPPLGNGTSGAGYTCSDTDGKNYFTKGSTSATNPNFGGVVTQTDMCVWGKFGEVVTASNGTYTSTKQASSCPPDKMDTDGYYVPGECFISSWAGSGGLASCSGSQNEYTCGLIEYACRIDGHWFRIGNTCANGCADGRCIDPAQTVACGDGKIDAGEECDDGNTASGDGCSASCQYDNAAVTNPTCTDTDGGRNLNVNGSTMLDGNPGLREFCASIGQLIKITSEVPLQYVSVSSCADSEFDTDRILKVGECIANENTLTLSNTCTGQNCYVRETVCGYKPREQVFYYQRCANGCQDNACIP